jgi:hypothetical protein
MAMMLAMMLAMLAKIMAAMVQRWQAAGAYPAPA